MRERNQAVYFLFCLIALGSLLHTVAHPAIHGLHLVLPAEQHETNIAAMVTHLIHAWYLFWFGSNVSNKNDTHIYQVLAAVDPA